MIRKTIAVLLAACALPTAVRAQATAAADANAPVSEQRDASRPDDVPPPSATSRPYVIRPVGTAGSDAEKDPHLFGDWFGIRPRLADAGIAPIVQYIWQPATNLDGGTERTATQQGQFSAGIKVDADKMLGIKGGNFQFLVIDRHGAPLNAVAGLGLIEGPQAVFGAGQIWRLADLWYSQQLGSVNVKLGRTSPNEDFGSGICFFESTYFCGNVPTHAAYQYFYTPPTSVWGGRVLVKDKLGYTQGGVYEQNPTNFTGRDGFKFSFAGATGVLLPIERAFTVALGGNKGLSGTYRMGVWYDTSRSNDLVRDGLGGLAAISGLPLDRGRGRFGGYLIVDQQVIAAGADGRGGLELVYTGVLADPRTNPIRDLMTFQAIYTGPLASRPRDKVGLAVGRINMNGKLADLQRAQRAVAAPGQGPGVQSAEFAVEGSYALNIVPGLSMRPSLQYYINPGAVVGRKGITVFGLGVFVTL